MQSLTTEPLRAGAARLGWRRRGIFRRSRWALFILHLVVITTRDRTLASGCLSCRPPEAQSIVDSDRVFYPYPPGMNHGLKSGLETIRWLANGLTAAGEWPFRNIALSGLWLTNQCPG